MSDLAVVVIMLTTVIALHMPGHLRTLPLVPALIYILLNRNIVKLGSAIKIWAVLFLCYITIFTLLAENMLTAWKGVYDIVRGCLYFFAGYCFGTKLCEEKHYVWMLLISTIVTAGNFLVPHGSNTSGSMHLIFYGYQHNPNSSAFVTALLLTFILPVFFPPKKSAASLLTGASGFIMGLILLYYANSRSAWIALFLGLTALGILTLRNKRTLLIMLVCTEIILLVVVLQYFNHKGFSIPVRLEAWYRLIEITVHENVWLGHGINNTKEILNNTGLSVFIAHNLLVDIFTSTGIIGTLVFSALFVGLARILTQRIQAESIAIQIGISGLVMFGFISMFDLKFASISLIGTFGFFSGVIYSQQIKTKVEYSA